MLLQRNIKFQLYHVLRFNDELAIICTYFLSSLIIAIFFVFLHMQVKVGDKIAKGQPWCIVHHSDNFTKAVREKLESGGTTLEISKTPVTPKDRVVRFIE